MPFNPQFDDVYSMIKITVENTLKENEIFCHRLDEARPAGRITDRLVTAIRESDICVADLTGNIPNVMWEVGYAMALLKPVIFITQEISSLPFDLKDMQGIPYDRSRLGSSLGNSLRRTLLDTLPLISLNKSLVSAAVIQENPSFKALEHQIIKLKDVIGDLVRSWESTSPAMVSSQGKPSADLAFFEGAWVNTESGSHIYAKIINNQLFAPYSYSGDSKLTAYYYDWKKLGRYWFSRFSWFDSSISGFSFLTVENDDLITGAWWSDKDYMQTPNNSPLEGTGVPVRLERQQGKQAPRWARDFFESETLRGKGKK